MSIIKKSEFKQMGEAQLDGRLEELRKELLKMNTQLSTHTTPENPGRIKLVKKTIAKILTMKHAQKKKPAEVKKEAPKEEKKAPAKKNTTKKTKTGGKPAK